MPTQAICRSGWHRCTMRTNKLMIADNGDGNCVQAAISTLRKVLDYDKLVPDWMADGWTDLDKTPDIIGRAFPNHTVHFWSTEYVSKQSTMPNLVYEGDHFEPSDFAGRIGGFTYYDSETNKGHMVIGVPCIYPGMHCSFAFAIEL